jgi:alkanesulfonate monooxygenase SsuD/methylene tetrahydromethanopterin reductase-like flavin-dependent oxidoreductase (luciferase family)
MGVPSPYLRLEDGTTWPHPHDPAGVEWSLRYGGKPQAVRFTAASYVDAYIQLVSMPRRDREKRIAMLRKAAEEARADG